MNNDFDKISAFLQEEKFDPSADEEEQKRLPNIVTAQNVFDICGQNCD